jgi:subtilase family serine protease
MISNFFRSFVVRGFRHPARSSMPVHKRRPLRFETLESRQMLNATAVTDDPVATPNTVVMSTAATSSSAVVGYTPAQILSAYGISGVTFSGGIKGDGTGQTIAIVDAYNDPNLVSDLKAFDAKFGISDLNTGGGTLKIVNQTGGSTLPAANRGWASEIALDVEWAHAIAPGANILLVEAKSASISDLDAAEDYARNAAGVVVVSNSWGSSEFSTESSQDTHFTTPSGHAGVTFVVAAGDDGAIPEYPSNSPDVLSVGGTSVTINSSGAITSETAWSGGGGGVSLYEGKPSYQSSLTTSTTRRSSPDVSYDANPNTGYAVYDTYGGSGWYEVGGTSAGAPQWSAIIAIADQGRALAGKASLANAQAALYSLSSSDFRDITAGSNGKSAGTGYDLATGLGSPIANRVIADLVSYTGTGTFTVSGGSTTTSGGFGFGGRGGRGGFGRRDELADGDYADAAASVVEATLTTGANSVGSLSDFANGAVSLASGDTSSQSLSDLGTTHLTSEVQLALGIQSTARSMLSGATVRSVAPIEGQAADAWFAQLGAGEV